VQNAVDGGADHLSIAVQAIGGEYRWISYGGFFSVRTWVPTTVTWSNPQLSIVVPEPNSWAMLLSGAALVLLLVRRRRSADRFRSSNN
jgi:hypothetical protein